MSSDEARAEADLYTMYNIGGMQPVTTIGEKVHAAFLAGAEWQRTRPVTDAEVEAAQVAYHEFAFGPDAPLTEREKKITRQAWRVALEDARKVEQ